MVNSETAATFWEKCSLLNGYMDVEPEFANVAQTTRVAPRVQLHTNKCLWSVTNISFNGVSHDQNKLYKKHSGDDVVIEAPLPYKYGGKPYHT